jgi:hypothetical protein
MLPRNLILLCAAVLVLAGCSVWMPVTNIVGSGRPVTQTFDFTGFDSLEISDAFQVELTASDSYLVEVTVDDNLVDQLQVEQQGATVKIGLKPFTLGSSADLRARIAMPSLAGLSASGASEVRGEAASSNLNLNLSGASTAALTGSGDALRCTASGASTADLSEFAVVDADVTASGASRVAINATGTLNAKASGASSVRYAGNPALGRIDTSGAGTISSQ